MRLVLDPKQVGDFISQAFPVIVQKFFLWDPIKSLMFDKYNVTLTEVNCTWAPIFCSLHEPSADLRYHPPPKCHWIYLFIYLFIFRNYWCWNLSICEKSSKMFYSIFVQWSCLIIPIPVLTVCWHPEITIIFEIFHVCEGSCCVWVHSFPLKKSMPKRKSWEFLCAQE